MYSVLNRLSHSLSCHKLLTSEKFFLRRISILEKIRPKRMVLDKSNHKLIYEFKYIIYPAGFLKTKSTLPIISVVSSSVCIYFNEMGWVLVIALASALQLSFILLVTKLTKNLIGRIYVNKKGNIDNVIISFIDSKGRRVDESYQPDQLCLVETALTKYLGLVDVEIEGQSKNYKLMPMSAIIYDINALRTLFKNISLFLPKKRISNLKKKE